MAEEIKLYKHFVSQLEKLGPLKRAWFTTFQLDIGFFEKYILTAIVGESFNTMNTPQDYEKLTDLLANDESDLDGNKLEVRVFYNAGGLSLEGRQKQTSVQLHPIDMKTLQSEYNDLDFSRGVFHPKVVLLETYTGEFWLMASSANLTLSGWARNREGFFCDKITNTSQARAVYRFFEGTVSQVRDFKNNHPLHRLKAGRFGDSGAKWSFYSSFESVSFLDMLNDSQFKQDLCVWSPYFADALQQLLTEIQSTHFEKISIVPAKNESQKIRITEESYEKTSSMKQVSFKQDKLSPAAISSFVHAKIWLTSKKLAIGSWNMTRAGMNISDSGNNVEAGIFYQLSPREYEDVINSNTLSPLKTPSHFEKEEMEEEKKDLLDHYTVTLDLVADWDKMQITLENPPHKQLIKQISENDLVILPGIGRRKISELSGPISFHSCHHVLLCDRFFSVENKEGTTLYAGYLRERGLYNRQAYGYNNMDDYLKAWISGKPEDRKDLQKLRYIKDGQVRDEISSFTHDILTGSSHNDWFNSFYAFEKILARIQDAASLNKREKQVALRRIGRVLPGSLYELRKHLENFIEAIRNDEEIYRDRAIYLWFLIEKANQLFSVFNHHIEDPAEKIKKLDNLLFDDLFDAETIKKWGSDKLNQWKDYIIKKLRLA